MTERHSHVAHELAPSAWFAGFAPLVPAGARVLDLACGHGRHARLFARRGCRVVAVDRDATALAALVNVGGIETVELDLERGAWPLASERFDAILVANYLHRPLLAHLIAALAPAGTLIYETFARGNEKYGRPSNPDFLLEPGELIRAVAGRLQVVAFEEGLVDEGGRRAVVQRLAAVGLERAWPVSLPGDRPLR